jgi:hypothetical protein
MRPARSPAVTMTTTGYRIGGERKRKGILGKIVLKIRQFTRAPVPARRA